MFVSVPYNSWHKFLVWFMCVCKPTVWPKDTYFKLCFLIKQHLSLCFLCKFCLAFVWFVFHQSPVSAATSLFWISLTVVTKFLSVCWVRLLLCLSCQYWQITTDVHLTWTAVPASRLEWLAMPQLAYIIFLKQDSSLGWLGQGHPLHYFSCWSVRKVVD